MSAKPGQRTIALRSSTFVPIESFQPELCPIKDNARDSSPLGMQVMGPWRIDRFTVACVFAPSDPLNTHFGAIVCRLEDDQ